MPTITTTRNWPWPKIASMASSLTPPRRRCQRRWLGRIPRDVRPGTDARLSHRGRGGDARSPRRLRPAITTRAFTAPEPAERSAPPRRPAKLRGLDLHADSARPGDRRQRGCRSAREFRHHDQTAPCRPSGRIRNRRRRSRRAGLDRRRQILEAPRGFFQAAGGGYDPDAIVHKLGNPWTFRSPGVSIKPFPSGSLTHPGMTEMARLIREHKIKAQQVERVDVGTNRNMPNALIHHQPKMRFKPSSAWSSAWRPCCSMARRGLTEFTDEVVNRSGGPEHDRAHPFRR